MKKDFKILQLMGKKNEFVMQNRKMLYLNLSCERNTFAEPLDFIKPKAKKNNRLLDKTIDVSLNAIVKTKQNRTRHKRAK